MSEPANPWRNPHHARAFGLVKGFADRGNNPDVLRNFMERIGLPRTAVVSGLSEDDVLLLSRMIEGYVDARGASR